MEAVMPLEVENPSLRVLVDSKFRRDGMGKSLIWIVESDQWKEDSDNLSSSKMAKPYDKKVWPRGFHEGDFALNKI